MRGRATVQLCTITPVRAPGDRNEKCDSELEALVRVPAVHAVYTAGAETYNPVLAIYGVSASVGG